MFAKRSTFVVLALLSTVACAACGGSDKPPPKGPELEPVATNAPEDMPAPASTSIEAKALPPEGTPGIPDPSATPASLSLPPSTAKIAMKGKKAANVELKSDGTITNGGKAVAKVHGMALESADGSKSLLTVDNEGSVTTSDGASYGSFSGDELTMTKGDKISLGDDGTLTMTSGGKPAALGKFDGASTAKRSAVLAAAFVLAPPAPAAADHHATPAGGTKPAAKKGSTKAAHKK